MNPSFDRHFFAARRAFKKGGWSSAFQHLKHAKLVAKQAHHPHLVRMATEVEDEVNRYRVSLIEKTVKPRAFDVLQVLRRKPIHLNESRFTFCHTLFQFFYQGKTFVGRKTVSTRWLGEEISELFDSRIQAHMILGVLKSQKATARQVVTSYYPLEGAEKLFLFKELQKESQCEFTFPFPRLFPNSKTECYSAAEGWHIDKARARELRAGEQHLTQHTIELLKTWPLKGKVIFDPACSTGDFLKSLKTQFPDLWTIGQDLSPAMYEFARGKVDELYLGDSLHSQVGDKTCDFVVFRFLNGEVVTTSQAKKLFLALRKKVKPSGYLILFGHTPVLLGTKFFKAQGLKCLQTIGFSKKNRALFQYYVLQMS